MEWEILLHEEFAEEAAQLPVAVAETLAAKANLLRRDGPSLGARMQIRWPDRVLAT
jgi:hypothetical protein